jgi:hypothetical protein
MIPGRNKQNEKRGYGKVKSSLRSGIGEGIRRDEQGKEEEVTVRQKEKAYLLRLSSKHR